MIFDLYLLPYKKITKEIDNRLKSKTYMREKLRKNICELGLAKIS